MGWFRIFLFLGISGFLPYSRNIVKGVPHNSELLVIVVVIVCSTMHVTTHYYYYTITNSELLKRALTNVSSLPERERETERDIQRQRERERERARERERERERKRKFVCVCGYVVNILYLHYILAC